MKTLAKNLLAKAIQFALLGAGSVALSGAALAADDVEAERIEVTGSKIKRTDIEGPSPVVVIDAEQINARGFSTVQDVLGAMTQNTGGQIDQSQTFGFTPGASAVDLRGFGAGRTLVLLDGRRLPKYPVGLGGTDAFVDLSTIPAAAVERIEILTDGASAIYGSDAISGVVNIILRKNIDGADVTLRHGNTTEGGYETSRAQFVAGTSTDKSSLSIVAEYYKNTALWSRDRDYAASDIANPAGNYSSYGSNLVTSNIDANGDGVIDGRDTRYVADPDCLPGGVVAGGRCRFNRTAFRQLYPEMDRANFMVNYSLELSPDTTFFSRFGYGTSNVVNQLEPSAYESGVKIVEGDARYPVAYNGTGAEFVYYRRLVEVGPRGSNVHNETGNVLFGLEGVLADRFDWEAGVSFNRTRITDQGNDAIQSRLDELVRDGVDLFDTLTPEQVAYVSYQPYAVGISSSSLVDFNISGDMFDMGNGSAQFALALDHQREWYSDDRDAITESFDLVGSGGVSGGGGRSLTGVGLELMFPLADSLELNIAGRYDSYDDDSEVGSAFSPRVALAWRPTDDLLLRASWGESFRAPDLFALYNGLQVGYSDVIDTPNCPDKSCAPIQSVEIQSAGDLSLEEEKGENFNIGAVWQVTSDLNLTVDYYNITVEGLVTQLDPQFILDNADTYGQYIHRGTGANNGLADGHIFAGFANLSEQSVEGVDLSLEYRLPTGMGDWRFTFDWSHVLSLETQLTPDEPKEENIGSEVLPENRINLSADWAIGDFGTTFYVKYIDELPGQYYDEEAEGDQMIDAQTTLNLQLRYALPDNFGGVRVGINNLTDEEPPVDPTEANWPWFRQEFHDAFGRNYYVEYNFNF
ncbi:MAG: TonB-dependent receptor plug domain-containing protein [Permianibacter sp.]